MNKFIFVETKPKKMNTYNLTEQFFELPSVNSKINSKTLLIYKKNGKTISIDDVSDNWFSKLSDIDLGTIDYLINNRTLFNNLND